MKRSFLWVVRALWYAIRWIAGLVWCRQMGHPIRFEGTVNLATGLFGSYRCALCPLEFFKSANHRPEVKTA